MKWLVYAAIVVIYIVGGLACVVLETSTQVTYLIAWLLGGCTLQACHMVDRNHAA